MYTNVDLLRIWVLHLPRLSPDLRRALCKAISSAMKRGTRRYQRGNQNPFIEEEQAPQWPKEKVQKDKQRPTKHTHKTKHRVTRTPLKISASEIWPNQRSGL